MLVSIGEYTSRCVDPTSPGINLAGAARIEDLSPTIPQVVR
jgi:hypothetical protein